MVTSSLITILKSSGILGNPNTKALDQFDLIDHVKTLTRSKVDKPSDCTIGCIDQFRWYDKLTISSNSLIGSDFPFVQITL